MVEGTILFCRSRSTNGPERRNASGQPNYKAPSFFHFEILPSCRPLFLQSPVAGRSRAKAHSIRGGAGCARIEPRRLLAMRDTLISSHDGKLLERRKARS